MFAFVAAAAVVAAVIVIFATPPMLKRHAQQAAFNSKLDQLAGLITEAQKALRDAGEGDWSRHAAIWLKAARHEFNSARSLTCTSKQEFQTLLALTTEQALNALESGIWAARQSLAWSKPEPQVEAQGLAE